VKIGLTGGPVKIGNIPLLQEIIMLQNLIHWFNRILSKIFKKKQDTAVTGGDEKNKEPSDEVYPLF